ncbi:hypothetical protein GS624_20750 [Ruegeria sp. HKCCD5849]|uniref:lysylphosphatidylglycerol synthase transmembrane domain-containing protein n=1 Tax=unclassified Ruegeria TaxID=2625375 RepID=UPI0014924ECB|nr:MULTISPECIES: lysylphosphatidylglycerol synthase transmembrane domain-containing protein [unclassified Ruegeria]NOD49751.1 hypothetical protein [Ruegeria sp. HKCCD5849]NOD54147.1 hypothetical protein [Ruegeria sp. HKCCD5851]
MQRLSPKYRNWLLRVGGSFVALFLLFWLLSDEQILAAFRSVHLLTFFIVVGLFIMAHIGAALKWRYLLDGGLPVSTAIRAHFAGLAANLCLPGAIGGDAVRAAVAYHSIGDAPRIVSVAAADRLIDMTALLTISAIGIVYASGRSGELQLLLLTGFLLALVFICLVMLSKLVDLVWRIFPSLPGRSFAEKLVGHFSSISRQPKRLLVVFLSSVAIQTALVLMSWWLGKAAGIDIDVGLWLFAWPLAKIIAVLPVTLNGLGLREGVLASMLIPFGADAAAIVAAGLVWQAVMFTVGGVGAVFLFITNRIDPAAQESWAATKDQQTG